MNAKRRADNTSGFKGVGFSKEKKKWRARIRSKGKVLYLGWFDSKEDAYAAYCAAAKEHHREFARVL